MLAFQSREKDQVEQLQFNPKLPKTKSSDYSSFATTVSDERASSWSTFDLKQNSTSSLNQPQLNLNQPQPKYQRYPRYFDLEQDDGNLNLAGYIATYSGSMDYQGKLSSLSQVGINLLLDKLLPHLEFLMMSDYGNYFVQKFFQRLQPNQRLFIYKKIGPNFINICNHPSGTHSIQGLIQSISTSIEEQMLESYINGHISELCFNENGNHVIQKIIIDFPESKRVYINDFMVQNIVQLCLNENGSLCITKFIMMNEDQMIRKVVSQSFSSNQTFPILISNKYGSNVLIYTIMKFGIEYFDGLFGELQKKQNLIYYSTLNEFSADFIWKFLSYINKLDHSYYMFFIKCLFSRKEGFVLTLSKFSFGEKLIVNLLKISGPQIVELFKKEYLEIWTKITSRVLPNSFYNHDIFSSNFRSWTPGF